MEWINVKESLPVCHSQHGNWYASGQLLTMNVMGEYLVNQYIKKYIMICGVHHLDSEYWEEYDVEITHWAYIKPPINEK